MDRIATLKVKGAAHGSLREMVERRAQELSDFDEKALVEVLNLPRNTVSLEAEVELPSHSAISHEYVKSCEFNEGEG
jgi:hypothetical protein